MTGNQILSRLAKLCKENIEAFGENYDPRWPSHSKEQMKGAKAEGYGVASFAKEVLIEIKMIRKEIRKKRNKK